MFGTLIQLPNLSKISRSGFEWLDEKLLGSTLTGSNKRRRVHQFVHDLVDQGYSREEIIFLAREEYG